MSCDLYFQVTQAFVKLIVTENLSFRLVNSNALRDLLESVSRRQVVMPSRHLQSKMKKFKYFCLETKYFDFF